jgi:hypothetical protein
LHNTISYQWKEPHAAREYRTAVSLHGHTNRSKEGLYFIVEYASRRPLLRMALATQDRKAQAKSAIGLNFYKAYWTPPLTPVSAYQLERDQIERGLGLTSMVSLTDHDSIEAPLALRAMANTADVPISVEWSVPFQNTTFHIGVHNLCAQRAEFVMAQLAEYTRKPMEEQLPDILKMLNKDPGVLVVLNHPMWDLAGIGRRRHIQTLTDFVAKFGNYFHAFELGGLRSWEENQAVVEFAAKWNQLVIGGGDRHGVEPSAVVNLSNASTFPEFVHEVRKRRCVHVLFMPQYAEPFVLRVLQGLLDAIREYPDHPQGWRRWDERVFHPGRNGVMAPLATLWSKPPAFIEMFFAAVRMLELPKVREMVRWAMAKPEQQMYFEISKGQEAASLWKKEYGLRFSPTLTTKSMGWRIPAGNLRRSREGANSRF